MASVILWPVSPISHKLPGPNRWVATGPSVQFPRQFYWAADSRWLWGHRETLGSRGHSQCGSYRAQQPGYRADTAAAQQQSPEGLECRGGVSTESPGKKAQADWAGQAQHFLSVHTWVTSDCSKLQGQPPTTPRKLPQLRHRRGRSLASVHENRHRKETGKPGLWALTQQWDTQPRRGP